MKGIVLIRDLLYLYTILFFCDWLTLKKASASYLVSSI